MITMLDFLRKEKWQLNLEQSDLGVLVYAENFMMLINMTRVHICIYLMFKKK